MHHPPHTRTTHTQQLPNSYPTATQQLPYSYHTASRQLPNSYLTATLQLPNSKKKSAAHKNGFEVLVLGCFPVFAAISARDEFIVAVCGKKCSGASSRSSIYLLL